MSSCDRLTIDPVAAAEKKKKKGIDRYRGSVMVMTVMMMDDEEGWMK